MIYMMQRGMQVNLTHFANMSKVLADDMDRITEKVHDQTGYYINLGSGDQVADLLFNKLKLKQARLKMTKGGERESVENEVLVAIQHDHESIPQMLEYKEIEKLKGTYVDPMPKLAKRTKHGVWRMYPNTSDCRVPSGRLNCKEPNLLAMPNRTARGREICEGFITDPGWVFLSVDFSQIEPRIAAHLSQDPELLRIYRNDEDIYSDFATAAFKLDDKRWECLGVGSVSDVYHTCENPEHHSHGWHYPTVHKKDHRFPAKTCILAWLYDVSGKGLLEQMPVVCANCLKEATKHDCAKFRPLWTEDKCTDIINAAGIQYPDVIRLRKMYHTMARRYGYCWDMWGRIIHATGVKSVHQWVQMETLRSIGNFPFQSSARGPLKLASAKTYDEFEEYGILGEHYHFLLDIHDELLGEVRADMADEIGAHIAHNMETCMKLSIPIKASMAKAVTWGLMPK
jgi:DNA polymerase-1